jgi:predicted lipoprotein with Yx(FWY)xxD motif
MTGGRGAATGGRRAATGGRGAAVSRRGGRFAGLCAVAGAAIALVTAGCATDDATSPAALAHDPPPMTAMPLQAADGALVGPQATRLGTVLVNGEGRTLYEFAGDQTNKSTCTGECAQEWPYVPAPTPLPAALPGVTGAIGSTSRPGGAKQLTIGGHPVYTYAGDTAPEQTNGQGRKTDGHVWSVVSATGAPVTSPKAAEGSTAGTP